MNKIIAIPICNQENNHCMLMLTPVEMKLIDISIWIVSCFDETFDCITVKQIHKPEYCLADNNIKNFFKSSQAIGYFELIGKLWGAHGEYFEENRQHLTVCCFLRHSLITRSCYLISTLPIVPPSPHPPYPFVNLSLTCPEASKSLLVFMGAETMSPQQVLHSGPPNTLRTRQNGQHFADGIYKFIFLNENYSIVSFEFHWSLF